MKPFRSFLALAVLAAAALFAAPAVASPPSLPSGNPVVTQSVSDRHMQVAAVAAVQVQASKDVSPISLHADSGAGAESAYQAWVNRQLAQTDCRTCRSAMTVHPGCGQREPHPSMAKGKRGGGKRCIEGTGFARIDIGIVQRPFTSST
jgi:hypothetical protein